MIGRMGLMERWRFRKAAEHQWQNVQRAIRGERLTVPSLGSMTLDADDVSVARAWLRARSCWGSRDTVARYEREFAHWNGSRHAFAFMSGRVALSACIHALALAPGDEVVLPGYTCVVVRNAFRFAGIATTYSDIELDTY